MGQEQLVDAAHQRQIRLILGRDGPVNPGAGQAQQGALPAHRQHRVVAVEHRSAVRRAHRPDLLDKKSRSTVSWPILA